MFLTIEELEAFTGFKQQKKQIEWLRNSGIKFMVNRSGYPLLLEKQVESFFIENNNSKEKRVEPDEKAFMKSLGI